MNDYLRMLEKAKAWVREVGQIQLEGLTQTLTVETKSSRFDPVTNIDTQSEAVLIARIKEEYPGHAVLSEEAGVLGGTSDYLWIIDPLDGTVNYAHGYPIFSISLALQYCGEIVFGLVYAPALKELFEGVKGGGAYLNGTRLRVAETQELSKAVLATGFPYDKAADPDNNLNYFNHLVPQISGIRRSGSAAFDLCNVAAGRLDGYWELKVNRWDIAAGALFVKEAGGEVIYLPSKKGISLIAGNERICNLIHQELVRMNPSLSSG
ncbi:MAG: inositol monophosphatase [Firmicutes bacterium]|nr:inositol monophosphatase [Bacillota bacterium]